MTEDKDRSGLDDDSRQAFLFKSASGEFLAVTLQSKGENIPNFDQQNWVLVTEFALGVHEAVPVDIQPEPILRGIKANGYFVWRAQHVTPFGSNQ